MAPILQYYLRLMHRSPILHAIVYSQATKRFNIRQIWTHSYDLDQARPALFQIM